jgi:integrase
LIINDKSVITVDGRPNYKRKYFKQPEEALAYAQELADFKANEVEEPLLFSSRLRVIASDGEKALRERGSSLAEAIHFYLRYLEKKEKDGPGISMREAIGHYIAARLKEYENGQITKVTYDSLRHRVKRDQAYFDKVLVKDVSPTMIMAYLEHGELGPKTRRNVKVRLSHVFTFCRMKGWIESNPCSLISIKVPHRDVEIFTIEETSDLMRECWYSDYAAVLIPFAAVCFFAGLRPKEAERLRWEFIDFKTKHIEITSATSKVRDTRFVHMEPNLIEWLKPFQQPSGLILGSTGSRKAWDNARAAVGWITRGRGTKPWISDGMRHSYASYWLAIHRNRAELAELMGNSPEIIRVHYRRPVLAAVAKKYWEITPETVCQKA